MKVECRHTDHNGRQINGGQTGRDQLSILIMDEGRENREIMTLEKHITWFPRKRSLCCKDLQRMIHPPCGKHGPGTA